MPDWQPGAVDPLALLAGTGPFGFDGPAHLGAASSSSAPTLIEPLVTELLRSIAWGGDRRRGTARIELGSGRYGGTALKVDAVGDRLHIDLEAPAGVDAADLAARLAERLAARGLQVESLTVR